MAAGHQLKVATVCKLDPGSLAVLVDMSGRREEQGSRIKVQGSRIKVHRLRFKHLGPKIKVLEEMEKKLEDEQVL